MMADGPTSGKFSGFSISLAAPSPEDAQRVFAALSEGGKVDMPLQQTFYSPAFGMLTDRFGVQWMVIVEPGAERRHAVNCKDVTGLGTPIWMSELCALCASARACLFNCFFQVD